MHPVSSPAHGSPSANIGPLAGLRVLDLSSRYAYYCGRLFADLGADVVLVEPPVSGCELRTRSPFIGNGSGPDDGIPFFVQCANKRGVTLDLDRPEGAELFGKLAATADLVIEDGVPGAMAMRGLSHADLLREKSDLVLTSITPFGQTGPYADAPADDLTLLALGGFLAMMGYPDREPTQAYGQQAEAMGCMFGAVGAMMALLGSDGGGAGQHVDISIQECTVMALENAAQFYDLEKRVRSRSAGAQRQAGTGLFPCVDGYVYIFVGGMAALRFWPNFVTWMHDEGVDQDGQFADARWTDMAFLDSSEAKQLFSTLFSAFAASRTKAQLYHDGQARRVPICPVSTPSDLVANRQLEHRQFFTSLRHEPSQRDITIPGVPFRLSRTPGQVRRPAPRLGEHNVEIYGELGIDAAALNDLTSAGVI